MRTTPFLVCTFFLFLALNEGSSSGDTTANHAPPEQVNVLFIAVDDLSPVITEAREAPHTGTEHMACSKTNAFEAKESIHGVFAKVLP